MLMLRGAGCAPGERQVRDLCGDCGENRERFLECGACEAVAALLLELEHLPSPEPGGEAAAAGQGPPEDEDGAWKDAQGRPVKAASLGSEVRIDASTCQRA